MASTTAASAGGYGMERGSGSQVAGSGVTPAAGAIGAGLSGRGASPMIRLPSSTDATTQEMLAPSQSYSNQPTPLSTSTLQPPPSAQAGSIQRKALEFPVLPPALPHPNQTFQTPTQVQSILSLPSTLLLHLARTPDHSEQQAIAHKANATSYLSAMTLPPPSPTDLVKSFSEVSFAGATIPSITPIGAHPAIPVLLGQVFTPPSPGITVPISSSSAPAQFNPTFASVEDWSHKVARQRIEANKAADPTPSTSATSARPPLSSTHSFSEREVEKVAAQLKDWAVREEEKGIGRQLLLSKETAVILTTQVSARSRLVAAASQAVQTSTASTSNLNVNPAVVARAKEVLDGGEAGQAVESALATMDLSPYSDTFSAALSQLASGYFAQLHREAFNRLLSASTSATLPPGSSAPTTPAADRSSLNVRAAASAAIAANMLASNEMAQEAGKTLANMGVDVPKLLPGEQTGGLVVLEVSADALAINPPSRSSRTPPDNTRSTNTTPPQPPPASQFQPPAQPNSTVAATASHPSQVATEVSHLLQTNGAAGCTPEKRDYFLAYAHTLYSTDPSNEHLLPLLHALEETDKKHLPTLLLMSCVYYTRGQLDSSLFYNDRLLAYDPNYVEAMSNIGTTLRAMGRWKEAESWWQKAINLRPTYWDATENLLGVLCNPSTTAKLSPSIPGQEPAPTKPRLPEALALCDLVDVRIFCPDSPPTADIIALLATIPRPRLLPHSISSSHVHRLQNLFYAKGNLKLAAGDPAAAVNEFSKAIEVALSLPAWVRDRAQPGQIAYPLGGATLRDLVAVTHVIGRLLAVYSQFGGQPNRITAAEVDRLGVGDPDGTVRFERVFNIVQAGGDAYIESLLGPGSLLPTVLLPPDDLPKLLQMLFPDTSGVLPSMLKTLVSNPDQVASHQRSAQLTNQTTSTMLLTIAKIFQDIISSPATSHELKLQNIPLSQSLLLPLYYVALALHPSPSTCNNLGILLSTMNATTLIAKHPGEAPVQYSGQLLAMKYYQTGLSLDPKHPHLYTNLGSLLKDMGDLPRAVQMYRQAVEFNPTFDVALANLANAIKDTGNIQDSIPFYRRAVGANPDFPEAICGLVNALGGVCDWIGRGGVDEPWVVDNEGMIGTSAPSITGEVDRKGYLGQISSLIARQVSDGQKYGAGVVRSSGTLEAWLGMISQAIYDLPVESLGDVADTWTYRLKALLDPTRAGHINEGGFVIRLVERLMRRVQRRWYLDAYQGALGSDLPLPRITPSSSDVATYRRPLLPPSLPTPPVPTVLPFHVFTYPVSPRETRLISHRTGLRISHSTLTQPWLPPFVYPPPPPPHNGRINIGYVSSDLGNHPLSHLMQSVFGFHDLERFNVFCYATSPSDKSPYRLKIEAEAQHFLDVSTYSTQAIVDRIVADGIHILVNLSGYTKGARNEVFACRPAPIQMSYMGFAGTLAAGWCDYFIVDPIVCPPVLVSGNQWRQQQGYVGAVTEGTGDSPTDLEGDPDPEGPSEEFVYTEKLIYLPHSYFVTDHAQAWFEDDTPVVPGVVPIANDGTPERLWTIEEDRRWNMRRAIFPTMPDDWVIFANWNQLYKIDPFIFRIWLQILSKHPKSILWLLRFPAPGEQHLKETARKWAGPEVANRVVFTDVANKNEHIRRGRIPDLFLDTTECNAHTTACDALAQGTPVLTWPRHIHKMCSRVATSVAVATGYGDQMVVRSEEEYIQRALHLAASVNYQYYAARNDCRPEEPESRHQRRGSGELIELRKSLFLTRAQSPLFDTRRWVRNMEKGYEQAWQRWARGTEFEDSGEWWELEEGDAIRQSGCIWVSDDVDDLNLERRQAYFA